MCPVQPAPGVEPPLPERSPSDPSPGGLALLLPGLPGLMKRVSWLVNPLSWDEMLESRSGATMGLATPCNDHTGVKRGHRPGDCSLWRILFTAVRQ